MIYLLHNAQDANSRAFAEAHSGDPRLTVIDWYAERPPDPNKFEYEGPPPSVFPSICAQNDGGIFELYELPENLDSCLDGSQSPSAVAAPGTYIGGMTVAEAKRLCHHPWYPDDHKSLITAKLAKTREADDPVNQFMVGIFADVTLEAIAKVELIKFFPLLQQHADDAAVLTQAWSAIKDAYRGSWCTREVIERVESLAKSLGVSLIMSLLCLFLSLPGAFAMDEVHNVNLNGTDYHVTELLHVTREKLPKWNALRLKRGRHYREYKLLDSDYTLKIYDEQYKYLKRFLKDVPDHRPFDEKHPYYQPTVVTANIVLTILEKL